MRVLALRAGLVVLALAAAGCGGTTPVPATGSGQAPPPAPSRHAVIWAVGDGADGGSTGRAVAARISAGRVDRLLYLGDVYEDGTASEFRGNYADTYGGLAARTAPTPGNHDWPNHATTRTGAGPSGARCRTGTRSGPAAGR